MMNFIKRIETGVTLLVTFTILARSYTKQGLDYRKVYPSLCENIGEKNGKEIWLYKKSPLTTINGTLFGMATIADFGDSVPLMVQLVNKNSRYKYLICTDCLYESLPDYAKRFILQHEIGHIQNGDIFLGDTVNHNKERLTEGSKSYMMEFAADRYAATINGVDETIKSISYMLKTYGFSKQQKAEFKARLNAIKEMKKEQQ